MQEICVKQLCDTPCEWVPDQESAYRIDGSYCNDLPSSGAPKDSFLWTIFLEANIAKNFLILEDD